MNILLVEDSKTEGLFISRIFQKRGHNVKHVFTIQSALLELMSNKDYDVVLTDYWLPGTVGDEAFLITKNLHEKVISISSRPELPHTFNKKDMDIIVKEVEKHNG